MSAVDSVKQTAASPDPRLYEPSMEEILASIRRIIADDHSLPGRLSASEEEDRLRAILTPPEAASPEPPPAPEPEASPVRAIFAPHPVAARPVASAPPAAPPEVQASAVTPPPVSVAPPLHMPPQASAAAPRPDAQPGSGPAAPAPASSSPASVAPASAPPAEAAQPALPPEAQTPAADPATPPLPASSSSAESVSMSNLFSPGTGQSVTAAFNALAATRLVDNSEALRDLARSMLRPMLKEWLDENLPTLVERLVRDEIERVGRGGH